MIHELYLPLLSEAESILNGLVDRAYGYKLRGDRLHAHLGSDGAAVIRSDCTLHGGVTRSLTVRATREDGLVVLKPACSICAPSGVSWLDVIRALSEGET